MKKALEVANLPRGLKCTLFNNGSDFPRTDGLLDELRRLVAAYPEDNAVRERLVKAYMTSIEFAIEVRDTTRSVAMAEALVPLREAVLSLPDLVPEFRKALADAIDISIEQHNIDAEQRLTAARKAIFGE